MTHRAASGVLSHLIQFDALPSPDQSNAHPRDIGRRGIIVGALALGKTTLDHILPGTQGDRDDVKAQHSSRPTSSHRKNRALRDIYSHPRIPLGARSSSSRVILRILPHDVQRCGDVVTRDASCPRHSQRARQVAFNLRHVTFAEELGVGRLHKRTLTRDGHD